MDKTIHEKLIRDIDLLKKEVSKYSSASLTGTVALQLRKRIFPDNDDSTLVSPAKQCFYLLGVMLTTPEPANPHNLNQRAIENIIGLLNNIFQAYAWMFWPSKEDKDHLTDEWYRCREVAMPAFLHYFNTSLMASVEQIKKRAIDYLQPFDDALIDKIKLSSSEVMRVVDDISNLQQEKLDELYALGERERELRLGLLERAKAEGWGINRLRQETASSEYADFIPMFLSKMDMLFSIEKSTIIGESLGSSRIDNFLSNFSIQRTGELDFTYITENNPAEKFPLFEYEIDKYFCPSINALYISALKLMESILLESSQRDSFLKARDKTLEKLGAALFIRLVGDSSLCLCELYETEDLQYEHDIIIIKNRHLYVIEAKASPPIEPFRDPEKAYTRLKRHFKSDRGIQKGFEQASRILKRLREQGTFWLYDNKAEKTIELKSQDFDNVFCICLTRDDYGPIATNLNLLLEKNDEDIYPWVINVYDLEALADGFKHLGLGETNLAQYIEERVQLHGKVFGTDELEYAGFFVRHGGLSELRETNADMIVLPPNYSDIFDEIYLADKSDEKIVVDVTEPIFTNIRDALLAESRKQDKKSKNLKKRTAEKRRKQKKKTEKVSRRKNRARG